MPFEGATTIDGLDPNSPAGGEVESEGDNHIRMLKLVLQTIFPNASVPFRFPVSVAQKTADYSVLAPADQNKFIAVNASGGLKTVSLPAMTAALDGFTVTIMKNDASVNTVTIDASGSDTINQSLTQVLTDQYDAIALTWCHNLSTWFGLRQGVAPGSLVSLSELLIISASNATTLAEYLRLTPTDFAVGKPYFAIQKSATATKWDIGLWDGVSDAGLIDILSTVRASFNQADGLGLLDLDSSHRLLITTSENLAADKTLDIQVIAADRTLIIRGNIDIEGAAVQADMETPASTTKFVPPAVQHSHPGHPKAAGRGLSAGGIHGTSFNVASITRDGLGIYTVVMTTPMANNNYAVVATAMGSTSGGNTVTCVVDAVDASSFVVETKLGASGEVDSGFSFAVFGDQ